MGTRDFRPPTESTSLNQSLKHLAYVITSTTATAEQNLVEIRSWGASGQIGEILRKFFYLYPFLSNSSTLAVGRTARRKTANSQPPPLMKRKWNGMGISGPRQFCAI